MKIVVFGASGKTGSLVIEEALALGFEVIAYVRKKESIKLEHQNLKIVEEFGYPMLEVEKMARMPVQKDPREG